MQGPLAQAVAFAVHGNAVLAGRRPASTLPGPEHMTCRYCETIGFVDLERNGDDVRERTFAADPRAWFARVAADGVRGFRLHHLPQEEKRMNDRVVPERMLVAFVGGGGRWLVEAVKSGGCDVWEARWALGDRARADQRIWRVSYVRTARDQAIAFPPYDEVAVARARLAAVLPELAAFARAHDAGSFAAAFDAAFGVLAAGRPEPATLHEAVAPPGALDLAAQQLLGAANAAWVFGGMGSWNDQGFDGEAGARYEALSEALYQAVIAGIVAAVNAGAARV